jgi:tetrahydromethanopterin S-methyltransferase subunit B
MKDNSSLILIGILIFIVFLGIASRSNDNGEYDDEMRQLEERISDLERCQDEYQYAIDEAKYNLESGDFEDAYYALDGVEPFCL